MKEPFKDIILEKQYQVFKKLELNWLSDYFMMNNLCDYFDVPTQTDGIKAFFKFIRRDILKPKITFNCDDECYILEPSIGELNNMFALKRTVAIRFIKRFYSDLLEKYNSISIEEISKNNDWLFEDTFVYRI